MIVSGLLVWLLAGLPQDAARTGAAPSLAAPLTLTVSAQLIDATGTIGALAGGSNSDSLQRYVWTDEFCAVASGTAAPANTPQAGWHFTAKMAPPVRGLVTVQVDWQRMWDHHARVTDGPHGTLTTALRAGARLVIDQLPAASNSCGTSSARLEIALETRPIVADPFGARGGRGLGAGLAAARGVAAAPAVGSPTGGRAGRGRGLVGETTYTMNLWLVHDGADQQILEPRDAMRKARGLIAATDMPGALTSAQTVRFDAAGAGFLFPPVTVATSKGDVHVIVMGTLSAKIVDGKPASLVITINREIRGAGLDGASGGTTKDIPWPLDSDVISFELPPVTGAAKDALAGQQFSLRLRLSPFGLVGRGLR